MFHLRHQLPVQARRGKPPRASRARPLPSTNVRTNERIVVGRANSCIRFHIRGRPAPRTPRIAVTAAAPTRRARQQRGRSGRGVATLGRRAPQARRGKPPRTSRARPLPSRNVRTNGSWWGGRIRAFVFIFVVGLRAAWVLGQPRTAPSRRVPSAHPWRIRGRPAPPRPARAARAIDSLGAEYYSALCERLRILVDKAPDL